MIALPPSFARVRVSSSPADGPGIWVPVFLLWPLWLLVLGLFCVLLLALTAVTGTRAFRASLAATRELHLVLCGLRGTVCEMQSARGQLTVSLL